jgi:CDP-glucose 4,6-dehydratase
MIGKQTSGEWNFGPALGEKYSVANLVDAFASAWGVSNTENTFQLEKSEQPHEADYLLLDSKKALSLLGWTNKLDFGKSVTLTAEWFKQSRSLNPLEITTTQIAKFFTLD